MRVVGEANKYLSDQAPWKLKEDPARRDTVLHTALQAIKDCNALLTPFLPHSSQQVHELLGGTGVWSVAPEVHEVTDLDDGSPYPIITGPYDEGQAVWASTPLAPSGTPLAPPTPVFTKLDDSIVDEELAPAGEKAAMSRSARVARANRRGEPPPSPEPLPAPALDSHTHLDIVLGERPAGRRARRVGVGRRPSTPRSPPRPRSASRGWCRSGSTSPSSRWSAAAGRPAPERARRRRAAPNEAGDGKATDDALAEIDRLAALPRVRAVGETGLDRYRTGPEGWAAQEASFRAHIRIAKEHGVALVIHDRDAHEEILAGARGRGRAGAHRLPLLLRRRRVRQGLRRARASCSPSPAP